MINFIITALKATGDVTSICPADNIFPLFRLQGSTLPSIVVQLTNTAPVEAKDAGQDAWEHDIEITCLGENPQLVWRLATRVRIRLHGYEDSANDIFQMRFLTQATDVFEATDVFSVTQRYSLMEIQ